MIIKSPVVLMFSGQGSHYYRMGEALYQQHPVFRQTLQFLDEHAKSLLGHSIIATLYDPQRTKMEAFNDIQYTHPAIFMVEVALARTLQHEGIEADYVLGASMGTFAAVAIAGGLSDEQGLTAVIEQADAIARHCSRGSMLAILDDPVNYQQQTVLRDNSSLAAVHFDKHFVVSGNKDGMQKIAEALDSQVVSQPLAVDYAFHSHWLDPAEQPFLTSMQSRPLQPLRIPLICCANAGLLTSIPATHLWQVVRQPVRFQKTIQALETRQSWCYIDVGPSGTLVTFLKYLMQSSTSSMHTLATPYGQEMARLEGLKQTLLP